MTFSKFNIIIILSFILTNLWAQKQYKIPLEKTINLESALDGIDIDICYELILPDKIYKNNKEYRIVSPKTDKPLAYGLADFRKSPQGLKDYWVYLISDYDQDFPLFYFDHNNNLDFTDDGEPVSYQFDSLSFLNGKLKARYLPFKIDNQGRVLIKFILQNEMKNLSGQILVDENEKLIPSKYWPNELIANLAKGSITIDDSEHNIEVYDFDEDNRFGTKRDLLLTGIVGSETKNYWEVRNGSFRLGEKSFKIQSINSEGSEITIVEDPKNSAPKKFTIGDKLDELSLETLSGEIMLSSLYKDYKYTLLDFWATWCKPCIAAMPELDLMKKEFEGFGIIGFATDKKNIIERFEIRYPHSWINVIVPEEIQFQFNILGLPTYYIIDSKGQIVKKIKNLIQLREFLNEN